MSESTEQKQKLPLHWQMLIALVAGTIIGVLINPGPVPLDDEKVAVEIAVPVVEKDDKRISIEVSDESGFETLSRSIDRVAALENVYEGVRPLAEQNREGFTLYALDVEVTERAVRIVENVRSVSLTYTRLHQGKPVTTTVSAAKAEKLPAPWKEFYEEHGPDARRTIAAAAKYVGDLFLRLLKMVTVPLIITSLITGVAGLDQAGRFGSMFGKTIVYYAATSLLAIVTGIFLVNFIKPGIGAQLPGGTEGALHGGEQTVTEMLLTQVERMIPANPISSVSQGEFLSIITFSIVFGVFIIRVGGPMANTLRDVFRAAFEVMMRMTMAIIRLAPIGVLGFMIYATASQGLAIFGTLAWYMLTVFLALVIHAVIVLPLIVKFVAKRSPIEYVRAMSPALMTAFSTASSNGTLPLTITCVEDRARISNRTSSFVLPLGATINMDGTALYEAVAVLFIAQAYHGDVTLADQVLVALTALLASVGAAGIPHAGLVMMAIVLQAVDLPLEAQGIIIAVDRVLDMCRTSVNVWSDSCGCSVIERLTRSES